MFLIYYDLCLYLYNHICIYLSLLCELTDVKHEKVPGPLFKKLLPVTAAIVTVVSFVSFGACYMA